MGTYISYSDFTDKVITDFGQTAVDAKITLSESALADLAERLGVDSDDIETDPVHHLVKEWSINWVSARICRDHIGQNNVLTPQEEKYMVKYTMYKKELKEAEGQINEKVLTGTVTQRNDRTTFRSGFLYRSS